MLVDVWTLLMTSRLSDRQRGSMTLPAVAECFSEALSSLSGFYLTASFSADIALVSECSPTVPSQPRRNAFQPPQPTF